jgi:hypothetical protein
MWFRHETSALPLSEGARFRRARGYDVVETARILAVVADPAGIPHVRFSLEIASQCNLAIEQRTLALDLFRTLYREPVAV